MLHRWHRSEHHPDDPPGRSPRQQGQAVVEFALIIPVFFLMFAGMIDFGMGLYSDLTVINAAREGARLGAVQPGDTSGVEDRVRAMASNLDPTRLSVSVTCQRPSGSSFVSCSSPMWQAGDATVVEVRYQYPMLFPLLFGTEIPLASEVSMRIE